MAGRPTTVAEYLAALPPDRRKAVEVLRRTVADALPQAEETFSYRMPSYAVGGRLVCALASQKHHLAFYVCETGVLDAFGAAIESAGLDRGKGCVRFRSLDELPDGLIADLATAAQRRIVGR